MKKIIAGLLLALQLLVCQQAHAAATATNSDYACAPPYLSQNAKPNIHFVLDYTLSMPLHPYVLKSSSSTSSPYAGVYNPSTSYYGYFKKALYYKYNTVSDYWEVNTNSTCDATDGIGKPDCVSGNLLNYATTSKLDVLRKIMTGGRLAASTTDVLEHELRDSVNNTGNVNIAAINCNFSQPSAGKMSIANASSGTCKVGTITDKYIRVKTSTPEEISGIIQSLYPSKADIEVSLYGGASVNNVSYTGGSGSTVSTGKNQPLANYINGINSSDTAAGTNTYTALSEAKKIFQQATMATTDIPAAGVIAKANGQIDPYYSYDTATATSTPAACRKSFIILVSDGGFNEGAAGASRDPMTVAYDMHVNDLRTDTALPGTQTVSTYTVYAFGDIDPGGRAGRNSLLSTALYGGFDFTAADKLPYPFTALSGTGAPADTANCGTSVSLPPNFTIYGSLCHDWTNADGTHRNIPQCNYPTRYDAGCAEWDKNKTGIPYNFFEGADGDSLETAINSAALSALAKVSSGSAASLMGNNDNSGSSLLQAMFYPEKEFKDSGVSKKVSWIGELQAFWYFVDPMLNNITIREDSNNDKKLDLSQDKIVEFTFDGTDTLVKTFADADGDGVKDASPPGTVTPDTVNALWRAGQNLWSRDPDTRTIFTNDPTQTTATKLDFQYDNATATTLYRYMDSDSTQAVDIIKYVRGDVASTTYRNRSVTIGATDHVWKLGDIIHSTPKLVSHISLNSYNQRQPGGYADASYDLYTKSKDYARRGAAYVGANDGMLHAFKLGTNFSSTTANTIAEINNADKSTATDLGKELWAFIPKNTLPYLQYLLNPSYQHLYMVDSTPLLVDASINPTKDATVVCSAATYSQCVKKTTVSPSTGLLSYNTTATNGTSWRTLLLGSTGMGGAASPTRAATSGVEVNAAGKSFHRTTGSFLDDGFTPGVVFASSGFTNAGNNGYFIAKTVQDKVIVCEGGTGLVNEAATSAAKLQQITVKTPLMDPNDTTKGFGYSSVFALDVTDPVTSDLASGVYPKLLWEFSDARLGFTTVTPAIVRIKDPADTPSLQRNGKWYAVLASGPSGPIANGWFLGLSDKKLTIFVLDLKSGTLVRTFSSAAASSSNTQFTLPVDAPAFAGSISGATTDTDKFDSSRPGAYSDDAIYIGYTRADSATAPTAWNKGGVVRLLTYNDPDPANWKISTLIDGIGPVTSAVTKLQDAAKSQLWLYFGTGRYYTKDDDPVNVQSLFGLKDPCFGSGNTFSGSVAAPCTTAIGTSADPKGTLADRTTVSNSAVTVGWYINLPAGNGTTTYSKRVITDTVANTNGVVNFTTFTPSRDVCSYGGDTSVWAVKYDTGGSGAAKLKGLLLVQLSTGAFEQINMATAFTESGLRESAAFKGVPPATTPTTTANANHFPTKRFLHIQER